MLVPLEAVAVAAGTICMVLGGYVAGTTMMNSVVEMVVLVGCTDDEAIVDSRGCYL